MLYFLIFLYVLHLTAVPGVIGCLQALEAIKVAGVVGDPLSGRMLLFDALSARLRVVRLSLVLDIQCEYSFTRFSIKLLKILITPNFSPYSFYPSFYNNN